MSLSSSSTLTDVLNQFNDNLAWDGDIDKAKLALEAVRWLLINRPRISADSGTTLNYETLKSMEDDLKAYVKAAKNRTKFTRGRAI